MDYVLWLGRRSDVDTAYAKLRSGRLRQRDEYWEVARLKVRTVHGCVRYLSWFDVAG